MSRNKLSKLRSTAGSVFVAVHSCSRLGCSLDVLLQGQRAEVESMITDMGVGQAAVEQLSIYCISLKK